MGWQDRPYYRDQNPMRGNPLLWLVYGSFPLFTVFGIRVRVHASFPVFVVLTVLFNGLRSLHAFQMTVVGSLMLFVIVLLHEFGHCFAARSVGGEARDILMTPLGGLAYAGAPKRPWPQFVTIAGGPAVNVLICVLIRLAALGLPGHSHQLPFYSIYPFFTDSASSVALYVAWAYAISFGLLIFNLLPIYPLDGGQLLQSLLWFKLGFYRATLITCTIGMVGATLMAFYGLLNIGTLQGSIMFLIGLNCLQTCYQMRAQLKAAGPWEFQDETTDLSAASWQPEYSRKHKHLSPRAKRRLRRQAEKEEQEQAQIDQILAKVSAHGMHSLTWMERRALRKATERQRQREIEAGSDR